MKNRDILVIFPDKNSCLLIDLKTKEMVCIDNFIDDLMNNLKYDNYLKNLELIQEKFKSCTLNDIPILKRIINANIVVF